MLFYSPTKRNSYRVSVRSSEGKRLLGRPRCRWEDITMVLGEIGKNDMDWINLSQDGDRLEGSCEHDNEHSVSIKYWEIHE
jgi:hypothetical protein